MRDALLLLSLLGLSACTDSSSTPDLSVIDLSLPADLAASGAHVVATIRGHLKNDAATSKQLHDAGAMMAKSTAQGLGDLGHYVFLGLPPENADAGAASDALLIIDEWTNAASAMQFYQSPNLQTSFVALFSAPPELVLQTAPADWQSYGRLNPAGQGDPLYLFSIRGPLSNAVSEPTYYNQLEQMGKPGAMAAGSVALLPYLRVDDATQAQLFGLWTSLSGALSVEGNPQFQAAVAKMFSQPPEAVAYAHTDWFQW